MTEKKKHLKQQVKAVALIPIFSPLPIPEIDIEFW